MKAEGDPFSGSVLMRCELFLAPHFRKARQKSRGDGFAARARVLLYAERSPDVRREMVRKAIGQASFFVGPHAPAVPQSIDPRPFTSEAVDAMRARVQAAADQAINDANGEPKEARVRMWEAAQGSPELAGALCALLILAVG